MDRGVGGYCNAGCRSLIRSNRGRPYEPGTTQEVLVLNALRQGLRQLGWVEGQNSHIAPGAEEKLPVDAGEPGGWSGCANTFPIATNRATPG